jgi:hypothetical protein
MRIELGAVNRYDLESESSEYLLNDLRLFYSDPFASDYAPIVYGGSFFEPKAEAMYYRILCTADLKELCLQFYLYWPEQVCMGGVIASHVYDYEPILLYPKPPNEFCHMIVNGGYSMDAMDCRFHKTEIHSVGQRRDEEEQPCRCRTSPSPFYPFGGKEGQEVVSCVKRYPLEASVYFLEHHPVLGLRECSHVFSGDAKYLLDPKIDVPLRRLVDDRLDEWYHKHFESEGEEPFGHDVSNPFEFPYVKYFDPKPLLRSTATGAASP